MIYWPSLCKIQHNRFNRSHVTDDHPTHRPPPPLNFGCIGMNDTTELSSTRTILYVSIKLTISKVV